LFGYVLLSVEAAVRAARGFLFARRVLDVTLDLADHFRERFDFGSESVDVGGDLFDGHDACWCSASMVALPFNLIFISSSSQCVFELKK
jgi:hypothetical protein